MPFSDNAYWLALNRAPDLGHATVGRVLGRFGSPREVFGASDGALAELGVPEAARRYLRHPDWDAVEADLTWLSGPSHHLLTLAHPDYPPRLREISNPPLVLFVQGDAEVLEVPQLAIVGSRNPTPAGAETARAFARSLAEAGLAVTSGLALGVDGAAHRGALAGGGLTVAVAGNGLDRVYPAAHRELAAQIAADGALVSEFPPGTPPRAGNFPRRNRVISGLSLGVLVVEAARRSGSLITARLASAQGREVFAIPGSIHNPLARGCHALLRQGAKLVETARDVLEEIGGQVSVASTKLDTVSEPLCGAASGPDPQYVKLLSSLGYEPTGVDMLVERTGLTPEEVSSMLLILELEGHVASLSGGLYARTAKGP
ncbi:MAG: DNA-protecting protein DprA [Gammaproteobacteria bacterium]|nr:DNA-protecting protein DprA [Gammaproteobacteria bacterium]NIR81788.1 DNA-protecting protein DprA [Gammaproteobacteria bacterium]NIR88620.1 DNA-protecting protein DprA [Gammaproteobacteria bacterium]NIU02896.1 DNA-protecting protein DprA [Gammaproteobacteria bacterium]NIV50417.1 DNA-protecting protein DprA [Gammaproteobacteria bacterium]